MNGLQNNTTMNEKVKKFIEQEKAKKEEQEKENLKRTQQNREEHLIKLGLFELENVEYSSSWKEDFTYDPINKNYFKGVVTAINVSDEEYDQICQFKDTPLKKTESAQAEATLSVIAQIILIIGLISGFSLIVFGVIKGFLSLIITGIALILSSLVSWGILRVLCNISLTLKAIHQEQRKI